MTTLSKKESRRLQNIVKKLSNQATKAQDMIDEAKSTLADLSWFVDCLNCKNVRQSQKIPHLPHLIQNVLKNRANLF